MEGESQILEKIAKSQQQFYEQNSKARLFKNNQKLQCAKQVTEQVNLQQMINITAFVIPNTNKFYFNYLMFKTYGHPDNCRQVYDHFHQLVKQIVDYYGTFEMHINLSTFTVSACVRYQKMIMSSFDENTYLTEKMTTMNVYHTPNVIEQITTMLYSSVKHLSNVTHFYKKDESDAMIQKLFEHV
jgi:hypothetical protein